MHIRSPQARMTALLLDGGVGSETLAGSRTTPAGRFSTNGRVSARPGRLGFRNDGKSGYEGARYKPGYGTYLPRPAAARATLFADRRPAVGGSRPWRRMRTTSHRSGRLAHEAHIGLTWPPGRAADALPNNNRPPSGSVGESTDIKSASRGFVALTVLVGVTRRVCFLWRATRIGARVRCAAPSGCKDGPCTTGVSTERRNAVLRRGEVSVAPASAIWLSSEPG